MKIERFYEYDSGIICLSPCSSDAARFWDFPGGSHDQMDAKKHWDESRINVEN